MAYAQADILQNEVFIFDRINNSGRTIMKFVHGIYFIRPTDENLEILKRIMDSLRKMGSITHYEVGRISLRATIELKHPWAFSFFHW